VIGPLAAKWRIGFRDPTRTLALVYDRAANAGRGEAPPSSRAGSGGPTSWR
jgi:hypothetical protein